MILILHIGLVTNYYMPYAPTALTEYGWSPEQGRLSIVWEAPENIRKAKANLEFVLSGCKTGCSTLRCSCKKQGRHCGPGCHCSNCSNGTDLPSKSDRSRSRRYSTGAPEEGIYVDDSDDDLTDLMRMMKNWRRLWNSSLMKVIKKYSIIVLLCMSTCACLIPLY